MARRRVVVTGLGVVSPVGNTVDEAWGAVKSGTSGIAPITRFDSSALPVHIAGEVKDFDVERYGIDGRAVRKMARFTKFLLAATTQAMHDGGYSAETLRTERAGIVAGCCFGGMDALDAGYAKYCDPAAGVNRLPPLTIPLMISNEAAANVSIYYGLQGLSWTLNTACASGTDAIGLAAELIRSGRLDVAFGGGTEAAITGFGVGTLAALQALSTKRNDAPEKASRPFDADRDGFVIAEGSAVLLLEEREHAKARGAHIYAELAGFGASCDAYHITAPLKDGSGAALAVQQALVDAEVRPSDVQYYNAHGTSTKANDRGESAMLKAAFGDHACKLKISSTKSMTGHLIGAAGAIEALFCVKTITDGFIAPTVNLDAPDLESGCDLDYVPNTGVACNVDVAVSASLGFGGHNGALVLRKYTE